MNMSLQDTLFAAAIVANVTFEWLLSLMYRFKMYLQVTLTIEAVFTNVTFEWPLFLMD